MGNCIEAAGILRSQGKITTIPKSNDLVCEVDTDPMGLKITNDVVQGKNHKVGDDVKVLMDDFYFENDGTYRYQVVTCLGKIIQAGEKTLVSKNHCLTPVQKASGSVDPQLVKQAIAKASK